MQPHTIQAKPLRFRWCFQFPLTVSILRRALSGSFDTKTSLATLTTAQQRSAVFAGETTAGQKGGQTFMRIKWDRALKKSLAVGAICFVLAGQYVLAQNLGATPQFNQAVQGQTGAQPEGAFLNFINWIGNVIAPVGAGGAVLGAIFGWLSGRGHGRWLLAAGALLAVSGVTRLIEYWITNGTGGVT
jgi:hypothetical protein